MATTNSSAHEDSQENLSSQFEKSAMSVRHIIDRVDKKYVGPGRQSAVHSFSTYPISSTFVSVFIALSLVPILSFIVLSLFISVSVLVFAVGIALTVAISAVLFMAGILIVSLVGVFMLSIFVTLSLLSTWVLYLFVRRRQDVYDGIGGYLREAQALFYGKENYSNEVKMEDADEDAFEQSHDTIVPDKDDGVDVKDVKAATD
ncbi:hypothetical protein EVG20_g1230 [Dentipellis fragilis]|uniref:Uncharacterized protein n=1 Tax=Dentipellis fragilis TaxID=205917 RepID=A0A4Y9ZBE2_9AGAM|nr:hypothetical protein EVG20_g1230 [Dentipellis fragilis]